MATLENPGGTATLDTVRADASSAGQSVDAHLSRGATASDVPLLEARPGTWAESFSRRVGAERPIPVFLAAVALGYAALVALAVGAGLVLTELLLPIGGFAAWDESINRWLADRRDPTLEHLSWIGSTLAGGIVIPVVVGFFLVAFLAIRRWRLAAVVLFVICIESGAYRATTLFVHRDRPAVASAGEPSDRRELPVWAHGRIACPLRRLVAVAGVARPPQHRHCRGLRVTLAIPLFVAWSRMYRGMHHLTDSVAGLLLGVGALVVTVFAARAAGAAANRRDARAFTDPNREPA